MEFKRSRGITLIALIVTIIVLIILAGVSINLLLGQDGIITRAKKGTEEYEKEAIREKVEIALADYNIDSITTNREEKVEGALNALLANYTFEDIDIENNIGMIGDYEIELTIKNGVVVIETIEKVEGSLRIRYRLSTNEYTNQNIVITVKAQGDVTKLIKPDNKEEIATNGKIEINYEISENKTYLFIAEDINGNRVEKQIVIDKIDTLPPKDFTITANQVDTKLVITAEAQDEEATESSVKSGIDKYEYFVKKSSDTNYPETAYTTNEIDGLEYGTYSIYVKAYDKAGNSKDSNEITVEIINANASKYGQKVNYSANGVDDWKIFYINSERNETFIITSDYLPTENVPTETTGMYISGTYGSSWRTVPNYVEITDDVRNRFMMSWNNNITNTNIKCVSRLLDTTAWSVFVTEELKTKGATAIGSPTLEMFIASWNDVFTNSKISYYDINQYGYILRKEGTSYAISLNDGKSNSLYFPYNIEIDGTTNYYLSSPSGNNIGWLSSIIGYNTTYQLGSKSYWNNKYTAIRPLVCIPSDLLEYDNSTSSWNIK